MTPFLAEWFGQFYGKTASRTKNIPIGAAYGSLTFFLSILHNIFVLYHVDTFVSIYKIDKLSFWIGESMFLLWNCINDPLFGWLSDRNYLRSSSDSKLGGDFRQVILSRIGVLTWSGPCFSLSFLFLWWRWSFPSLQFVFCLCLYDGFLTLIDLHHSALLADLDVSNDARTKLGSFCSLFSGLGSVSVFGSYMFWDRDDIASFRPYCVVLASISFCGFLFCSLLFRQLFLQLKSGPSPSHHPSHCVLTSLVKDCCHDVPSPAPHHETRRSSAQLLSNDSSVKDGADIWTFARQLSRHRNFFWFSAMNVLQCFHCHFNSNFFPLFMDSLLQDRLSPQHCSLLLGLSFVIPHINNLYSLSLCRRHGAYKVIRWLFVLKILLGITMIFIWGPNDTWILCAFLACNRVFTEGTCKLLNLVVSDLVDEDCVLHNRRQTVSALIFGTAAFLSKPGQTLAPLIGTWLISVETGRDMFQSSGGATHIRPASPVVDSLTQGDQLSSRSGFFRILVYVPLLVAVVQLFCWCSFTLHGDRLKEVKRLRRAMGGSKHYSHV